MKGLRKRAIVLAAVATLAMSSLAGCASDYTVDNDKVAVVVGDTEITLGVLNFYLRYDQAQIEAMYTSVLGDDVWKAELSEGKTYEATEKETVIESLKQMYILEDHMEEYGVTFTEDELAEIEKAAEAFIEANGEAAALVSGDKANIEEVLRMCAIATKMYDAMVADVSTEVEDSEAAQKKLAYLGFTESETVTLEQAKEEAEIFLAKAKQKGDLMETAEAEEKNAYEYTFDSETTLIAEEMVAAADKLKEGEFAEIVEADNIYYVVQLVSEFDEEATEDKKAEIVAQRQYDEYESIYEEWKAATTTTVYDDVVAEISMHGLKVNIKAEEVEESEETEE